ncbi:MAG: potassium-transporting ATPase subunit C [Thermoplasmata archaeon]|nr:potassium-transporting ATPase subunit C [Thermoplasmata archaeon]
MTAGPSSSAAPVDVGPTPPSRLRRGAGAFRASALLLAFIVVFSGVLYPLGVTILAQQVTPGTANGSILHAANGTAIASALIGQNITNSSLFWLRPSMIDYQPYTGAGNEAPLGPSDPSLINQTLGFIREYGLTSVTAPISLVSLSASGLDPVISLGGALVQIPRIAANTSLTQEVLRTFVNSHAILPTAGIFGPPYVNVIQLDLILIHDLATNTPLSAS